MRRSEKAFLSVVQEAYVHGVSTRKVDDLVRALGSEEISRSELQRCRVQLTRNLLGLVPRGAQQLVGAWVRTIFAQPDQEAAREQLEFVAQSLEGNSKTSGSPYGATSA